MEALQQLNQLVALGTLLMDAAVLVLLGVYFFGRGSALSRLTETLALPAALALVLASIIVSLVYSDYFGITPCFLCWYQRVFLYPQVILFTIAMWMKDARVWVYSIGLSIVGGAFALYQHYIQMVGESPFPCPANGGDCLKRFLFEYGFVTFPFVALSAFALLIVLMLFVRRRMNA